MSFGGWVIMIVSVGTVCALFGWCMYTVLTTPGETERMHGFDSDKPDEPA